MWGGGRGCRGAEMEGWRRAMWFDETNLTWINPSPNMRSLTEATLYPGVGLLETTNVSVGRGTDTPFEIVGAPWIQGDRLAEYLNQRGVPGVRFVPLRFTPKTSVFKDQECGGVNIIITDRAAFRPVATTLVILDVVRRLYGAKLELHADYYDKVMGTSTVREAFERGEKPEAIVARWAEELREFGEARKSFLLYA